MLSQCCDICCQMTFFVGVAGNPRHPLALLRVGAILVRLAHRVSLCPKASTHLEFGLFLFLNDVDEAADMGGELAPQSHFCSNLLRLGCLFQRGDRTHNVVP
jgi:hypothetical protein